MPPTLYSVSLLLLRQAWHDHHKAITATLVQMAFPSPPLYVSFPSCRGEGRSDNTSAKNNGETQQEVTHNNRPQNFCVCFLKKKSLNEAHHAYALA